MADALPGYVYIFHGIGTRYIKIGQTENYPKRLSDLEHGVPFYLETLSLTLVHDMDDEEDRLLAHYSPYAARGEWFTLPDALLAQWPITPLENDAPHARREMMSLMERILEVLSHHGQQTGRHIQLRISGIRKARIEDMLRYMVEKDYLMLYEFGNKTVYRPLRIDQILEDAASLSSHPILSSTHVLRDIMRHRGLKMRIEHQEGKATVLHVSPMTSLTEALRNEIRCHKDALVQYVESQDAQKKDPRHE